MIEPRDPLRLVESDDAPLELRQLLQQAHEHRLCSVDAARLLRFVEDHATSAGATPAAGRLQTPARLAHLPLKSLSAMIAVMGLMGAALVASRDPSTRVSREAQRLTRLTTVASSLLIRSGIELPRTTTLDTNARMQPLATARPTEPSARVQPQPQIDPNEYQLLRTARDALARDPARALALADQHARQFATGMLAQEREAIAVDALVRLGSVGPAKARAQRFLRNYPHSPYAKRIESAIKP